MKVRTVMLQVCVAVTIATAVFSTNSARASGKGKSEADIAMIKKGEYLVTVGGCADCHSPKVFTPMGPVPDTTRFLSGHPADSKLPDVPAGLIGPDAWGSVTTNHFTAWAGPWGVSFARNLTPDMATGIGSWTADIFIKAIRTGKDMGEGRDILPPMPWPNYAMMTDDDLKAMFAYLQSLKPIENQVPDPISPTGESLPTLKKSSK